MPDTTTKPVIFLAFANDRDDKLRYLRNLPDEARRLRDVLEAAERDGLCEVVVRSNSTAGDIFKVFQDPDYRNRIAIFHYGGHANGYQLLLESAAGEAAAADAGGLAAFLAQQRGLRLMMLNGCSTQQQTQGLLDANIPAVISTSRSIEDKVATDFAVQFYQGLAGGATIRTAYNEAEAAIQTAKGGKTRDLYFDDPEGGQSHLDVDRWPWNLYLREGSERADQWNLPEAVDDPLFGLPELPEQDLPNSPYRHLNWFTRKDAEVFFGRGHQIRELYDRLTAPHTAPILLFYGQSGVGKSSILDAGLLPRLEHDYAVRYARRGANGLLATLTEAIGSEAAITPIDTAWRRQEDKLGKPLSVILDQVEELFTHPIADLPDELGQLLHALQAIFSVPDQRPQGKLVLGFRKEWLAELESRLVEHELPRTKVFLEPLDRHGIIEAVEGPTRSERLREQYGLSVEDGLAEIIADDLLEDRDSAIAPTLQILLTKLWAKASEENYEQPQFTQALYQNLKRDGILLRDFLDQQISAFRREYPEAVDSGLLLDIVALHTTKLGTAGHCSVEELQEQYAHLGAKLPDFLQQCQDLQLLTVAASAEQGSRKTTRLAHDTLAPLVRKRFEESRKPGQRARRILDNRSVDWKEEEGGTPLDESDLVVVEEGIHGTRSLNPTEQRLLEASRELRVRLRRSRKYMKVVVGLLLLALFAGPSVWLKAQKATDEARVAIQERDKTFLDVLSRSEVFKLDDILGCDSDPGRLEAFDKDAWVSLVDAGGSDFVLARVYGEETPGRILATGHERILVSGGSADDAIFPKMALMWLRGKRPPVVAIAEGHAETLKLYGVQPEVEDSLTAWDYQFKRISDLSDYERLQDVGVLILGNAWKDFTPAELEAIEHYVRKGGGVLALGLGWSWRDYGPDGRYNQPPGLNIDDYPMNKLMKRFGVAWTEGTFNRKANCSRSPL